MKKRRLTFEDCIFSTGVVIDNSIYCFAEKDSALMEVDMADWMIKYSDRFSENDFYLNGHADMIKVCNGKIYKLLLDGSCIEVFPLKNGSGQRIFLGDYKRGYGNFVAFEEYGQFLYVFQKWDKNVIRIDTFINKKEEYRLNIGDGFAYFTAACRYGSIVWLFEADNQRVTAYDMDKNALRQYTLCEDTGNCEDACWYNGNFFLLFSDSRILIWDPLADKSALLWDGTKYYGQKDYFGEMTVTQKQVILLPGLGDDIVCVDTETGAGRRYEGYPSDFVYLDFKWGKYTNRFEDEQNYYYPMRMFNYLMVIHKDSGEIHWQKLAMPLAAERLKFQYKNFPYLTDDLTELLKFQQIQSCGKKWREQQEHSKIGDKIWIALKN